MWGFIGIIGLISFLVFLVLGIIALFKRNGTAKKKWLFAAVSLIVFIVGVSNSVSSTPKETATEPVAKSVEKNDSSKVKTEEEKKKDALDAQKKKEEAEKQLALLEQQKYANLAKDLIPEFTDKNLELDDKTFDFISNHSKLFPAKTPEDIQQVKNLTDTTIESKHLNKNVSPYLDKMVVFSGSVVNIEENKVGDESITLVHILDDDLQSYQILLFKPADNVFEDDQVKFWGVPVGPSSFDNVSGGTTNTQFFVGADLEKL
jgi:hypothetical protein